jgi:hypothetical protein
LAEHLETSVQFLNSKIPQPLNHQYADNDDWEPSDTQKSKFLEYYKTVDDPVGAMRQIKNGGLTNEAMESLNNVYPSLLDDMRTKLMEHMDIDKVRKMTMGQQIALSKFMGQPLTTSLSPQALASNQSSFLPPQPPPTPAPQGRGGQAKHLTIAKRSATRTSNEET